MKRFSIADILKSTFIMFLTCLLVAGMLAGANYLTHQKIADNNYAQEEATRYKVLKMAEKFEPVDINSDGEADCYAGYANDMIVGYTFITSAKGYGGDVTVMTGILFDGKINDVAILSHSETPGLGAKADNSDFTDRFKQAFDENGFAVTKDNNGNAANIDAITGATVTSRAVTSAVNEAIKMYYTVAEKEGDRENG